MANEQGVSVYSCNTCPRLWRALHFYGAYLLFMFLVGVGPCLIPLEDWALGALDMVELAQLVCGNRRFCAFSHPIILLGWSLWFWTVISHCLYMGCTMWPYNSSSEGLISHHRVVWTVLSYCLISRITIKCIRISSASLGLVVQCHCAQGCWGSDCGLPQRFQYSTLHTQYPLKPHGFVHQSLSLVWISIADHTIYRIS